MRRDSPEPSALEISGVPVRSAVTMLIDLWTGPGYRSVNDISLQCRILEGTDNV